jgi:hypothetical protein
VRKTTIVTAWTVRFPIRFLDGREKVLAKAFLREITMMVAMGTIWENLERSGKEYRRNCLYFLFRQMELAVPSGIQND